MRLEAVIQLYDEWVIQQRVYVLLVLYDVLFLILSYELFKHDFHGIELTISKRSNKINLTKAPNGKAFTNLILLESTFLYKLNTIKSSLFGEYSFADRDLIVEYEILIHRLKCNDLCSL